MKSIFLKAVLGVGFALLLSAAPAWCSPVVCDTIVDPSIALISSSAGVYNYGILVPAGAPDTCSFFPSGSTISFTGLGGVTGTSVSASDTLGITHWSATSFTSTSALFSLSISGSYGQGGTYGTLTIDCSSCTTGTVNWDIVDTVDPAGTVAGPVGASVSGTPESSTIGMLLAGLAALGLLAWKKGSRNSGLVAES